jgi:protein-ribulosamine 3-kinase
MDSAVRIAIERMLGRDDGATWRRAAATGWTEAWVVETGAQRHFIKLARHPYADMIACEAEGLRALGSTNTVRVPKVTASGNAGSVAYLALEWLDIIGAADDILGGALARLHRAMPRRGPCGERFGWHRDNWIGATPQLNAWSDDWCTFFRDRRLAPQVERALAGGRDDALARDGERLLACATTLLESHDPTPSLVHGDLWSGNAATIAGGDAVVFDPAVHVGDREVDIAMTELFGGFRARFRKAYDAQWPLDDGYALRRDLYNCYHLLNHVNLFGDAYVARTRRAIAGLADTLGF